jgi:hypothetical protein
MAESGTIPIPEKLGAELIALISKPIDGINRNPFIDLSTLRAIGFELSKPSELSEIDRPDKNHTLPNINLALSARYEENLTVEQVKQNIPKISYSVLFGIALDENNRPIGISTVSGGRGYAEFTPKQSQEIAIITELVAVSRKHLLSAYDGSDPNSILCDPRSGFDFDFN